MSFAGQGPVLPTKAASIQWSGVNGDKDKARSWLERGSDAVDTKGGAYVSLVGVASK